MTKKAGLFILAGVLALSVVTACSSQKDEYSPQSGALTYADYINTGMTIAVQTGGVFGDVARDIFMAGSIAEYTSLPDLLESVRVGRANAALVTDEFVKQLINSGDFDDFNYLTIPEDIFVQKSGPIFQTEELRDKYNEWFAGIAADGTWQEMTDFWIISSSLPAQEDIPVFEFTGENGILRACDTGNYPPLVYFDANAQPVGFGIEMVNRFALHMGMKPEFTMMAYEAIIPHVISGKSDMSAATFAITDEREESVLFGEASVISRAVLIIPAAGEPAARTYAAFVDTGKIIGVQTGELYNIIARDLFKAAQVPEYTAMSDLLEALRMGRVDAVMTIGSYIKQLQDSGSYPDFDYLWVDEEFFREESAPVFYSEQLRDKFNEWLAIVRADGTLDEIRNRWLGVSLPEQQDIPKFEFSGENGTLRVCDTGNFPPYIYFDSNGEPAGYDIDIISRFAMYLGMDLDVTMMAYDAVIPYVTSGRADMSACFFGLSDERREGMIFSDPVLTTQAVLIVRGDGGGVSAEGGGFVEWLKTGIRRNLITDNRWRMIAGGLGVTMIIAVLSQIFGTVFGCFVCYVLTRKNRLARWIGDLYCWLIHGLPIVVLLMITYYIIFGNTAVSNVIIAVAAFTLVTGAGIARNLKGAIDTVDPVEIEAARSIGFSAFGAFRAVTLPQAVRRAMPGYTNGFVELVKATAIVGYVAIQDMMRAADIIRSRTYDAYFPLLFAALIYLIVTTVCIQLFKLVIKKTGGGEAR